MVYYRRDGYKERRESTKREHTLERHSVYSFSKKGKDPYFVAVGVFITVAVAGIVVGRSETNRPVYVYAISFAL